MSTLTLEALRAMLKALPTPAEPVNAFANWLQPFRPDRFAGRQIFEAPPAPPRLEVRDIRLKDGTPILSPEFRARINSELLERFGRRRNLFDGDTVYLLGRYGMVCSHQNARILSNLQSP